MSVKNSYPELPEVEYYESSTDKQKIINLLRALNYKNAVKQMAYIICYNESAGFKKGINTTNYAGFQADSGRWAPDSKWKNTFLSTTVKNENMTGDARRFLVFKTTLGCLDLLCYKINERGMYLGAAGNLTPQDLALSYWHFWVKGDNSKMPANEMSDFITLYNSVKGTFA